jgi:hypothetical protein
LVVIALGKDDGELLAADTRHPANTAAEALLENDR